MTLAPLPAFAEVFQALHGHPPYPWQERLAHHVVTHGVWPKTIGVPTGTGKTATLDIALYALAAEADRDPSARHAPRRVVMVVDRRTIVDQAYARGEHILATLMADDVAPPLAALRDRLAALMGHDAENEAPLQLALLRGGVPRDDGWARRPDQALLAVSTVDQVGSRLLFRGYGVRPTMQSVHAGLLGHDTLFLLDEVHLARPFFHTLQRIGAQWRTWRETSLPDRWQVVSLSATSGANEVFDLTEDDVANPRIARRLTAAKPLTLHPVSTATHDRQGQPHKRWVKAVVEAVGRRLADDARCVGVVVNRVDTARAVAAQLARQRGLDTLLVTGRMRGCDRAEVGAKLEHKAGPSWSERRSADQAPFVCVATQCIEAGADLDFDAMVTEVASLDALVQRFGRANRTGDHQAAPVEVLAPKDVGDEDPIYGNARSAAWAFLEGLAAPANVGTQSLREALPTAPAEAFAPATRGAVLLPAHLDLLSQTGPVPEPDPNPALYLHGLAPVRPEVSVVWRADVELPLTVEGATDADQRDTTARLSAVPPTTFEALSLPLGAARRWLENAESVSLSDAGAAPDADDGWRADDGACVAWAWDGSAATPVAAKALRPGMTLVVPSSRGGLDQLTFAPGSNAWVTDRGDLGRTLASGRAVARLDVRVHGTCEGTSDAPKWRWKDGVNMPPAVPSDLDLAARDVAPAVLTWAKEIAQRGADTPLGAQLRRVLAHGDRPGRDVLVSVVGRGDKATWVLTARRPLARPTLLELARGQEPGDTDTARTADDASVVSGVPVALTRHLTGVEAWARALSTSVGLPPQLVEDVARAGRWHDLGKAHPQFQVLLHGGDEVRATGGPLLAKSGARLGDRAARQRAWERAALPDGFRHEMASVALLTASDAGRALLDAADDPELVLHLVASHHGHARPFAPPERHEHHTRQEPFELTFDGQALVAPADHGCDALDSGVSDRFWRLQRRYGWWGLAWLEAILRLADHRESEAEERNPEVLP